MLKPRKRLTRATLKEDKFVTYTSTVQSFIQKNYLRIVLSVSAFIVIAAVGGFISLSKSSSEKTAAFESFMARDAYGRGEFEEVMKHVNIILEDYPGAKAAASAMMLKGRVHEQRGDIDDAVEVYKNLTKKYSEHKYLGFGAHFSIGSIYFGQEKYEEAAQHFSRAASTYPDNFNAPYSLLEAGISYKKIKMYDKAKTVLKKIISDYPKSRAVSRARNELEEIEFML